MIDIKRIKIYRLQKSIYKMNQHSPNWGVKAYSYIQALTNGIAR